MNRQFEKKEYTFDQAHYVIIYENTKLIYGQCEKKELQATNQ